MGSQVCKSTANDSEKSSENNKNNLACFQVCYPVDNERESANENINPIEFSDLGSDREQDPQNQNLTESAKKLFMGKKTMDNFYMAENSTSDNLQINAKKEESSLSSGKIELVIVQKEKTGHISTLSGEENYTPISVPFSVIKLMLKPEILKQIKFYDKNFEKKHSDPNGESFKTWKLQAKGFYTNFHSDGTTTIATPSTLFTGFTLPNTFTPEGPGLLITSNYSYKGTFQSGQASGKGAWRSGDGGSECSGVWQNGRISKGKYSTPLFSFEGTFKEGIPEGKGTLELKATKVKYQGEFRGGVFEDTNAVYECPTYTYKGGFKGGRKNGLGELIQKESNKKGEFAFRDTLKIKGEWEEDRCVRRVKEF